MTGHPYTVPVWRELRVWPGVTARREARGKHKALLLTFAGKTTTVFYPPTPSDGARGLPNHMAEVRKALKELGAVRVRKLRGRTKKKHRTLKTVPHIKWAVKHVDPDAKPSPLSRDPWEALTMWLRTSDCEWSGEHDGTVRREVSARAFKRGWIAVRDGALAPIRRRLQKCAWCEGREWWPSGYRRLVCPDR